MAYQHLISSDNEEDIISDSDEYSRSTFLKSIISDSEDEGIANSAHSGTSAEKESTSNSTESATITCRGRSLTEKYSNKKENKNNYSKTKRLQNSITLNQSQVTMEDSEEECDLPRIKIRTDFFPSLGQRKLNDYLTEKESKNNIKNKNMKKFIISSSDSDEDVQRVTLTKRKYIMSSDSEVGTPEKGAGNISSRSEKSDNLENVSEKSYSLKMNVISSDSENEIFRETKKNMSLHRIVPKNQIAHSSDSEIDTCERDLVNTSSRSEKNRTPNNVLDKNSSKINFTSPYLDAVHNEETIKTSVLLERLSVSQKTTMSPAKLTKLEYHMILGADNYFVALLLMHQHPAIHPLIRRQAKGY
ncbi:unnamed protein product [Diabrotica balteata]|uniref:Uncharacterized protein n=1 Tax=Diabrotica balteata TaxID=107213 RepID=A0A9P0DR91_DIABA|nr:unnamed protein product [Diabrotica balteata]